MTHTGAHAGTGTGRQMTWWWVARHGPSGSFRRLGLNECSPVESLTCNDKYVGDDPKTKGPIRAPFIEFDDAYVDITASEAMRAVSDFKSPGTGERARTLLRDMLAGGEPVPESVFQDMAKEEDISRATMKNMKRKLRIKSVRSETVGIKAEKGHWMWQWPEELTKPNEARASGDTS